MASNGGTAALVLYKQGILFQGGPADIMARRWVLPDGFDPAVDNPYAYENMECAEIADDGTRTPFDLLYPDGSNPNYVRGLCPATALNLSGNTIVACDDGSVGENCADSFPWDPDADETEYLKVVEWEQTVDNFNDQSWENPYDVAKGHRGFMNGDFIMLMYGWSPNWKALTTGHDHNNIYVRRSFDGGDTWTTTPTTWNPSGSGEAEWTADGTTSCEIFRDGAAQDYACTDYGAGEFEPARNVSLLDTFRVTVLDPRFTPTPSVKSMVCDPDEDGIWENCGYTSDLDDLYDDDADDPSMFFVTYQTGDNTTVAETEPIPLDMFYSRAVNWGDEYVVWTDPADAALGACVPVEVGPDPDPVTLDGLCNEFDWLENKRNVMSAEAALQTNPGGTFLYAIWDQWKEDPGGIPYESDAIYRRIWFIDDGTSVDPPDPDPGSGPGPKGKA